MKDYRVAVPVKAESPEQAAQVITIALGMDQHSVNDIGGLEVTPTPTGEKQFLVCRGCGEAFDSVIPAHEHGTFIPGPDPSWCGEAGFDIVPESEAF